MNTHTSDYLILGGGLYGCATAYHLAKYGARNITVLERGSLGSGGTAKSCAIIRTHYSVEANLVHAVESLRIFSHFDEIVGGDVGFHRTGYLIIGPEAHREPMETVFRKQNGHGIDTATLTPREAQRIHPLLQLEDAGVIGYDTQTGYADPHLTTMAYARRAGQLGVHLYTDTPVTGLSVRSGVLSVETAAGTWQTSHLILCLGPWTQTVGALLGVHFPYVNSRHKVITLRSGRPYRPDWPIVKDLTTEDKIYFRPETGGVVLVGTGDHGDPLEDPDLLTDTIDAAHLNRIASLITHRMPDFEQAEVVAGWTGPYDITPDWNPIVGAVPDQEGLYVAVGFSGHGFKLAPTIAEGLAQTVLGLPARVPIDYYDFGRFASGELLQGAYGIGSIS